MRGISFIASRLADDGINIWPILHSRSQRYFHFIVGFRWDFLQRVRGRKQRTRCLQLRRPYLLIRALLMARSLRVLILYGPQSRTTFEALKNILELASLQSYPPGWIVWSMNGRQSVLKITVAKSLITRLVSKAKHNTSFVSELH